MNSKPNPNAQPAIQELPHDSPSEYLVLYHAVHRSPESAKGLVSTLTPGCFYGHATKCAFAELTKIVKKGTPLTIESLLSALKARKDLSAGEISKLQIGCFGDAAVTSSESSFEQAIESLRYNGWLRELEAAKEGLAQAPTAESGEALEKIQTLWAKDPRGAKETDRVFEEVAEDVYRLAAPDVGVTLTIDRLRREKHSLIGEMRVECSLAGARTVDNLLHIGELNLSSTRARQDRGKYLAGRARTNDLDWTGLLEEFAQRVLSTERQGKPAVELSTLPRPEPDDNVSIDGLTLPWRHPSILFGDGGAAKSYLTLYFLGRLYNRGFRVALFDWELAGEDHRDRLELLFGQNMPQVFYARCDRPLVDESDRLRRIVQEEGIQFAAYDSIAFGCDGPPEAAEVASRYFRAVRQIGVGGIHVAHVSKAEGSDQKPFGSAFWHNGARATWFAKLADATADKQVIQLGLFNRKSNTSAIRSAMGFEITFNDEQTEFRRVDLASVPDLAATLSIRQRMINALGKGAMSREKLAETITASEETVKRTAYRDKRNFIVLTGGKDGFIGLRDNKLQE